MIHRKQLKYVSNGVSPPARFSPSDFRLSRGASSLLCGALLLCVSATTPAHGQTLLRWKWAEGEKLSVEFNQQIETETRVNRIPIKMSLAMGIDMDWSVTQVDSQGVTKLSQSFRRLRMTMKTPKQPTVQYDSQDKRHADNAKSIAESIGPLIGAEFFVSVDPLGKVVNVQLSKEAQAALDAASETSRVKELFSKEGVSKLLRQSAGVLPKMAVREGDSWKEEQSFVIPMGKVAQTNTYIYRGRQERDGARLEKIDVVSRMAITPPADNAADNTARRRTTLKTQETKGIQWFDAEKGRLIESTTEQTLTTERPFANAVIEVLTTSVLKMKILAK